MESALSQPVRATSKWVLFAEWLLFALMASYFVVHTFPSAWKALNTDFPNYYLTARLSKEHSVTSRIYESVWLQRQKDHREIDQPILFMGSITPFSTLVIWPFASMPPLQAKHCWLIVNLLLVVATAILLQSLTRLSWRRVALVVALSVPLNKNFLYGQYYLLLLFVFTLACWCYIRERRFLSGLLIGIGFGLKLFPLLYLAYFLRKRDLKAFLGSIAGSAGAAIVSVAVFGWQANRMLAQQVLPWTLRGEGMDPYNLSSGSIATLLHRLFVYEPQLNPTPTIHAAWIFAVLLPLSQTILFAPALLLAEPGREPERLKLEWSAVLLGSLAISTLPAGYHFTLLILPVCLVWGVIEKRAAFSVAALLILYTVIGYPGWKTIGIASPLTLFSVPRLYLVVLLCGLVYWILATQSRAAVSRRDTWLWAGAFALSTLVSIAFGLRHQKGLYADYQWRIPTAGTMLQASGPATQRNTILFTAMVPAGYRTATQSADNVYINDDGRDQLAVTANSSENWTEEVGSTSTILPSATGREIIHDAESPIASPSGRWLAYLHETHGRNSLRLNVLNHPASSDREVIPTEFDVLEMAFLPNGSLIFSAQPGAKRPTLFLVDQAGSISSLGPEEARYPAISPDGRWFAFSRMQSGNWHLWLRDLQNGQTNRLTEASCNNVEPVWAPDSKTLIYASDCGRALGFTALCRRKIIE